MSLRASSLMVWIGLPVAGFAVGWLAKPEGGDGVAAGSGGVEKGRTVIQPGRGAAPWGGGEEGEATGAGGVEERVAGRGLSLVAISAIGRELKGELDPIARRRSFAQLLDGLTVENAKQIREQIAHLPAGSPEFRDFHYAWGKIGGVEAIMNGAETQKPDMAATLAGWASAEPGAALKWFEGLEERADKGFANQGYLKMGMLHGLSDTNPEMATDFVLKALEAGDKQAGDMMNIVTGKVLRSLGAVEAASWAVGLPEGKMRNSAVGRVAHDYAQMDPEKAAGWVEGLDEDARKSAVGSVSHQWARRDGAATVGWLSGLEQTVETSRAYYTAFEGWAGKDPAAASEYLVDMPASDGKDYAISGLVSRHRWEDPRAAIAWAEQISHERGRTEATIRAGEAFYRKDQVGAIEWMAESGLSAEAMQRITRGKR